jgi:hypothetical protein
MFCVTYLVNFCPEIVFILDNNYKIAQDVALIHNHRQIHDLLENTYNTLLHSRGFDLQKTFRKTIKDVKIRLEKFEKLTKKSLEKVLNDFDYTTVKKSDETCLISSDEVQNKFKQSFIGRLMAAPK